MGGGNETRGGAAVGLVLNNATERRCDNCLALPFSVYSFLVSTVRRERGAGRGSETKGRGNRSGLGAAESWGRPETLAKHFKDHGANFGAKSAEEYAQLASRWK
jgi:hypothetical protein